MKEKFRSDYDVGTSAVSETYFKDLKNSDLNDSNGPTRVDKFFVAPQLNEKMQHSEIHRL